MAALPFSFEPEPAVDGSELADQRRTSPDGWADLNLLTADDVCALLKVKKSWLYDTVESGAITAIRLGRQLRFRRSDIAAYLDQVAS